MTDMNTEPTEQTIAELRNLCAHLLARREEDRLVLTREIHDGISQAMTAIKFQLQYLQVKLESSDPEIVRLVESAVENADSAVRSIRRLYELARPLIPEKATLKSAIDEAIEELPIEADIAVTRHLGTVPEDLPMPVKRALYLVAKSSLGSLAVPGGSGAATIDLDAFGGQVYLTVRTERRGTEPERESDDPDAGILRVMIREMVLDAGGTVEYRFPNNGTAMVHVTFPWTGGTA